MTAPAERARKSPDDYDGPRDATAPPAHARRRQAGGVSHSVVIVGAGPVGLLLGCELAALGCNVTILERRTDVDPRIRSGGLSGPVVRALENRGLLDLLIGAGGRVVERPGHLGALGLERLTHVTPLAEPNRRLTIEQQVLEAALEREYRELGGAIVRGVAVADLKAAAGQILVNLSDGRTSTATYVVGCDGAGSTVRERGGFTWSSWAPRTRGYQAMARVLEPEDDGQRIPPGSHRTTRGLFSWTRGRGRVVTIEYDVTAEPKGTPTAADVEGSLQRVSGLDFRVVDITSASRFSDRALLCDDYRRGAMFLAGDAAHVIPPNGGQGLSVGMLDALNLGWKLAGVINGRWDESLLNSYTRERNPVAARALLYSRADVEMSAPGRGMDAAFELYSELKTTPLLNELFLNKIALVDQAYDTCGDSDDPLLGRQCPSPVSHTDKTPVPISALLSHRMGLLVIFSDDNELDKSAVAWSGSVQVLHCRPFLRTLPSVAALLLRPDGVVCWIKRTHRDALPGSLRTALTKWFGPPSYNGRDGGETRQ